MEERELLGLMTAVTVLDFNRYMSQDIHDIDVNKETCLYENSSHPHHSVQNAIFNQQLVTVVASFR